jgi:hypothetical protein
MATKKKPTTEAAAIKPKNAVNVDVILPETEDAATARVLTKPEISAALTIQQWQGGITEVNTLASELAKQIGEVNNGDMKRPEAMLLAQAHTLDELFNNLARRAKNQEYLSNFETYLRLALKAQTQCRATLETLAAIKNPPIVYAKQANFANGHQQVNNGITPSHTGETKNQQNELLTELPDETLDAGRTGAAIEADKAMAAVD